MEGEDDDDDDDDVVEVVDTDEGCRLMEFCFCGKGDGGNTRTGFVWGL